MDPFKPQVTVKPNVRGMQVIRRNGAGQMVGAPSTLVKPMSEEEALDAQDLGLPVPQRVVNLADAKAANAAVSNQLLALQRQNARITKLLEDNFRIAYLNALLQQPQPVGSVLATVRGNAMTSAAYVALFTNTHPDPVALQVCPEWHAGVGVQVYLSKSTDASNEQVVDVLGEPMTGEPAKGKSPSSVILVNPEETIYIAPVDFANFPPAANDLFRVRIWAPSDFMVSRSFTNR